MAKKIEEIKNEAEIIEEAKELVEAEAEENAAEVTEEKQEGKLKKFGAGVVKHGKRLAIGTLAVIGGITVAAKVLSGKQVESEDAEETSEDVVEETE